MEQKITAPRDMNAEKKAIDTFTFTNNRPPSAQDMWKIAQDLYGGQGQLASQGSYQEAFKGIDQAAYDNAGVGSALKNVQHFNDPTNYAPYKGFDQDIEGNIKELNAAITSGDYDKAGLLQKNLMVHAGTKSSYTKAFLASKEMARTAYQDALSRYQRASELEREGYKLDRASKESLAENLFKAANLVKDYDIKESQEKRAGAAEGREAELHPLKVKELEATIKQKQAEAAKALRGDGGGAGGFTSSQAIAMTNRYWDQMLKMAGTKTQNFDPSKGGVQGGREDIAKQLIAQFPAFDPDSIVSDVMNTLGAGWEHEYMPKQDDEE